MDPVVCIDAMKHFFNPNQPLHQYHPYHIIIRWSGNENPRVLMGIIISLCSTCHGMTSERPLLWTTACAMRHCVAAWQTTWQDDHANLFVYSGVFLSMAFHHARNLSKASKFIMLLFHCPLLHKSWCSSDPMSLKFSFIWFQTHPMLLSVMIDCPRAAQKIALANVQQCESKVASDIAQMQGWCERVQDHNNRQALDLIWSSLVLLLQTISIVNFKFSVITADALQGALDLRYLSGRPRESSTSRTSGNGPRSTVKLHLAWQILLRSCSATRWTLEPALMRFSKRLDD